MEHPPGHPEPCHGAAWLCFGDPLGTLHLAGPPLSPCSIAPPVRVAAANDAVGVARSCVGWSRRTNPSVLTAAALQAENGRWGSAGFPNGKTPNQLRAGGRWESPQSSNPEPEPALEPEEPCHQAPHTATAAGVLGGKVSPIECAWWAAAAGGRAPKPGRELAGGGTGEKGTERAQQRQGTPLGR